MKKYAVFSGRARRKEYWMYILFNIIFSVVLSVLDIIFFGMEGFRVFSTIYSLALLIPGIAVGVRRLHDTGRTGWWMFIALIPLIGAIILLVFFVQDSQPGNNKYGPNPKAEPVTSPAAPAQAV